MKSDNINSDFSMLKLENQLCFPLYVCSKEIVKKYRKPLSRLGITYTQYITLMALWEHGDMNETSLGNILHLDSGTLAPMLKRLEKNGFINRRHPEDNERKLLISLTDKGIGLKKEAASIPSVEERCLNFSEEEITVLKDLLNRAIIQMEESK